MGRVLGSQADFVSVRLILSTGIIGIISFPVRSAWIVLFYQLPMCVYIFVYCDVCYTEIPSIAVHFSFYAVSKMSSELAASEYMA